MSILSEEAQIREKLRNAKRWCKQAEVAKQQTALEIHEMKEAQKRKDYNQWAAKVDVWE